MVFVIESCLVVVGILACCGVLLGVHSGSVDVSTFAGGLLRNAASIGPHVGITARSTPLSGVEVGFSQGSTCPDLVRASYWTTKRASRASCFKRSASMAR